MEMKGEQRIFASRQVVWDALNDPDVLKACIPGCQELTKLSDTEMTAVAVVKVGPVKAKFQAAVTLSDLDAPNGYRITGEGQGGVAGFAKGSAIVRLHEDGNATLLTFNVLVEIGGKLSQLGARLIDATAKHMSAAFFKRFAEEIDRRVAPDTASAPAVGSTATSSQAQRVRTSVQQGSAAASGGFLQSSHAMLWLAIAAVLVPGALFLTGALPTAAGRPPATSPEFSSAVTLLIVLAVGYLLGIQSTVRTNNVVHLDPDTIDALADAVSRKRGES